MRKRGLSIMSSPKQQRNEDDESKTYKIREGFVPSRFFVSLAVPYLLQQPSLSIDTRFIAAAIPAIAAAAAEQQNDDNPAAAIVAAEAAKVSVHGDFLLVLLYRTQDIVNPNG